MIFHLNSSLTQELQILIILDLIDGLSILLPAGSELANLTSWHLWIAGLKILMNTAPSASTCSMPFRGTS